MSKDFTEAEARKLIGCLFETLAPLVRVPLHSRGRVVEAINAEDHWNVRITWVMPGIPVEGWYTKQQLRSYMKPVLSTTS